MEQLIEQNLDQILFKSKIEQEQIIARAANKQIIETFMINSLLSESWLVWIQNVCQLLCLA